MKIKPDEYYSSDPTTQTPRPQNAWKIARPHVVYADYLFRRICREQGFGATIDTVISGKVNHTVFAESLSIATRIVITVPIILTINANRKSDRMPNSIRERESRLVEWLLFDDCFPNGATLGELCQFTFLFGFFPALTAASPLFKQNPKYKEAYEDGILYYAKEFDYTYYLSFKFYLWRWKRYSPTFWE